MNLHTLLDGLHVRVESGNPNTPVTGIEIDSRKVQAGNVFVAIKGEATDGHLFIESAIQNGASVIIHQETIPYVPGITYVKSHNTRELLPFLVDVFYQSPTRNLRLIGITGTNGKTTTSNIIHQLLNKRGKRTGIFGTIKIEYADYEENATLTTAESTETQKHFSRMLEKNVTHAVMEVSSHALDLGRTKTFDFDIGVFTNLTQDHLDYHETMEEYKKAKGLLFSRMVHQSHAPKYAVLNADDEATAYYTKISNAKVLTYGIHASADIKASNIKGTPQGMSFEVATAQGTVTIETKMMGIFNVYNLLAAIAVCLIEHMSLDEIKHAIQEIEGVEGRMEIIDEGQPFKVIVDFAHTPDALENLLKTVQEFTTGNITCVIGCGGNRDKGKRPLMASIAAQYSHQVILTSDNPRNEDPTLILQEMEQGLNQQSISYTKLVDRKEAIEQALLGSKTEKDCVVIAGKGHETYQIIGNTSHHFDDRETARSILKQFH